MVSVDMRPPTSIPKTTKRARLRGPTSSGYVRSFLRRALCKTTTSMFSAPLCGDPSQWRALTTAASTTNWQPPNRGSPSTTTSNLRASAARGSSKSKSRTMTLVVTLPPASRQTLAVALSNANPRRPNTPARTRCSVVAKLVNLTATPANVQRKKQWKLETLQQHNTGHMGRNASEMMRWNSREGHTGPWTSLRPHLRSVARPHVSEQLLPVLKLHLRGCHMLPSTTTPRLHVFGFCRWWAGSVGQILPSWRIEPQHTSHCPPGFSCSTALLPVHAQIDSRHVGAC